MRIIAILSLLLLASPVFGELTKEDLRTIIKEEVRPIIKEEITASEKRTREYIDLKIETVNTKIDALDKRNWGYANLGNCAHRADNRCYCDPSDYHRLQRERSERDANPN